MNPFMGVDASMMGGGMMPDLGATMPFAQSSQNTVNAMNPEKMQQLGKLLTALGTFQKPGAQTPTPQMPQAPQMPQMQQPPMPQMPHAPMGRQAGPAMQMQMPARPQPMGQGMMPGMQQPGMGMGGKGIQQVPPADVMQRLMASLSQYGG